MPDHHYLLVDGGYLRARHAEAVSSVFEEGCTMNLSKIRDLNPGRGPFHRVFYYDSLHDIPKVGETEEQFQARVTEQQAFFDGLQAFEGFHVRLGSLSGTSRKFRQKEVDILLAVDALEHSFRRNLSAITLMAGDLDFVPLVDSLVRTGTWVEILYDKRSFAQRLLDAADKAIALEFHNYYPLCNEDFRRAHPLPNVRAARNLDPIAEGYRLTREGTCHGRPIGHYARLDEHLFFMPVDPDIQIMSHHNPVVLENYFGLRFGPIVWA
jgi:uncharacterized LabA/DUF88 family protein